jgi:hypothetical protein
MLDFLKHIHSGLRWVALLLLVMAIFNALMRKKSNLYEKKDKMINLFAMITLHVQLLIGLWLYFISPKVQFVDKWMSSETAKGMYRFFNLEHFLMMLVAIVLITIGRKKAEKSTTIADKHKKILVWYTIVLLIIIAAIPWPFRTHLYSSWI